LGRPLGDSLPFGRGELRGAGLAALEPATSAKLDGKGVFRLLYRLVLVSGKGDDAGSQEVRVRWCSALRGLA